MQLFGLMNKNNVLRKRGKGKDLNFLFDFFLVCCIKKNRARGIFLLWAWLELG